MQGIGLAAGALLLSASVSAWSDWREDVGTLRIGMLSPNGGSGIPGLSEMTMAFQRAAGIPTEILVARDYPALIRAMAEGRIHYGVYSATAFAAADAVCDCVEPLALAKSIDGAVGLKAVLIGRRGHAIDLRDIAGKRIVAGPAGEIGPQTLAVTTGQGSGPEAVIRAASNSDAEKAFLAGDADVLAGWMPAYAASDAEARTGSLESLVAAGADRDDLAVLWTSETVFFGPHAVRKDLPGELKDRLRRFLTNLADQQPDIYQLLEQRRGGGFVSTDQEDYASARAMLDVIASR